MGIELFEVISRNKEDEVTEWGDSILLRGHHAQWRSSAFDGEGVYSGMGPEKSCATTFAHCALSTNSKEDQVVEICPNSFIEIISEKTSCGTPRINFGYPAIPEVSS